ncbi:response regulator [Brevundimonas intermedia]|uniref:response regulator n=1 Tax=Brevundimonas intermedia TaxID=74315 RepID=UPI003D32576D
MTIEGRLLWVNDYLSALLGLAPGRAETDGRRLLDHLTPASRILVQTRFRQELALGGRVEELALDVVTADGSRLPVMVNAAQLAGEAGAPPRITLSISRAPVRRAYEAEVPLAKRRAEAEREAAAAVIAAFVRHSPVPLVMTDQDLVVTRVSHAWEQFYRRDAAEIVGRRIDARSDPRGSADTAWADIYARGLAGESLSSDRPVRSVHRDMWFEWAVIPWRDAQGEVGGLLLMNFDVTALVQARDAATAADGAKTRFLANLSHELRTPMNGVLAPIALIRRLDLPSEARDHLDGVARAGADLARSLTTLLDFSQLENGDFATQVGPVSVRKLCDDVLADCADLADGRNLVLNGPSDVDVVVLADEDALKRILVQLVSNGLKFTPAGEVSLEARHDGETLMFTVADTGSGFDAAEFSTLLQPFHQRDASRTRRHGGMGLGLALAQGLAARLDGALSAESVPGRGSRIRLRLPAASAEASIADVREPEAPPSALRVLAVDDHPANLAVLTAILSSLDAEVVLAGDGLQAVEAARAARFDLILMDIQMPVMDGLTAMRAIRAEHANPPPIIVISANVSRPEIIEARLAGAAEVLGKPVSALGLLRAIATTIPQPADDRPSEQSGDRDAQSA